MLDSLTLAAVVAIVSVTVALTLVARRRRPTSIRLSLPTVTTKEGNMADIQLANDLVYTVPILTDDGAGNPVPAPPGDTFSVSSSDTTSLGAAIGTTSSGQPAVVLTPLKQNATAITVTVTDSAGLQADVAVFDIAPGTPAVLALDFKDQTTAPQPVPPS